MAQTPTQTDGHAQNGQPDGQPGNGLQALLLQAHNPGIDTRDQYPNDQSRPDNPHIAPGWNALMVQDIVMGMFIAEAVDQIQQGGGEAPEETPEMTGAELEQHAPGAAAAVTEAVAGHILSDNAYSALLEDVRELAQHVVRQMPGKHRAALMEATARKVRELQPGPDEEPDGEQNG